MKEQGNKEVSLGGGGAGNKDSDRMFGEMSSRIVINKGRKRSIEEG